MKKRSRFNLQRQPPPTSAARIRRSRLVPETQLSYFFRLTDFEIQRLAHHGRFALMHQVGNCVLKIEPKLIVLCPLQSFQPTQIFEEGTTEEKGENARLAAFVGAIAVGDLVKSNLGPKGMDKILQSAYVSPPTRHPFSCCAGQY
jgi:hypothetical protein